jgi:hypothetical protein
MSGRMAPPIGAIALIATLLVSSSSFAAPADATTSADDCLAAPNSGTPRGGHWYYHIDRATHRKCWYLGTSGEPTQQSAVRPQSETATAAQPPAMPAPPAPAAPSVDVAMPTSDSAPPAPHVTMLAVKPKPTPNGATADHSVVPSAPQASDAQTAPQAFAAPADASQATGAAPDNSGTWPDPPTTASASEATTPAASEGAASVSPNAPVQASDDAESAADRGATDTSTGLAAKSATPTEMFLILVTGLGAAVFLFGVAIKIVSDRRVRIVADPSDSTFIDNSAWVDDPAWVDTTGVDDQHPGDWRDDQQLYEQRHHGQVDDRGRHVGAQRQVTAQRPVPAQRQVTAQRQRAAQRPVAAKRQVAWINDFPTERIESPAARPQARPQSRRPPQDGRYGQPRDLDLAKAGSPASADDIEMALRAIRQARNGAQGSLRDLPSDIASE